MRRSPIVLACLCLAFPAAASTQETPSDTLLTVDHYLDWESVADPQISPDGSQVAFVAEGEWDAQGTVIRGSEVWVVSPQLAPTL